MKKIIIPAVVVIALLSAPYFVGTSAEAHIDKMLEQYNQNPSFKITKTSYAKGWFSSTASYELELVVMINPEMPEMPTFKMSQTLYHGPILWKHDGIGFGLMDSIETIDLPEDWKKIQDALLFSSRISFDGTINASATLNSVEINEEGMSINILPATGNFSISEDGHVVANFDWQGLKAEEQNSGGMELSGFHIETDQQLVKGEMYAPTAIFAGKAKITVDNVSVKSAVPGVSSTFSDLALIADSEILDDLMNVNLALNIADINAVNQHITNFVYDLSMLNLDIESMQEFTNLMVETQESMQLDPAASMDKIYENFQAILPKLLAKDPILKINNIGFTVEEGDVVTELTLTIDKDKFQAENIDSLIGAINIDSIGSAPTAIFAKYGLGPTIDGLVEQKMLTRQDTNIGYEFKMVDGQTILNGTAIPLF